MSAKKVKLEGLKKEEDGGWTGAHIGRLEKKKENLFKDPNKRRKGMKDTVATKLTKRYELLQQRPWSASKDRKVVEQEFRDFISNLNSADKRILNYDPLGLNADNYRINAANRDSSFVAPYYVNTNGHLRGGRTIAMQRQGDSALMPLKGPDGRILLGALGKYWSPTLYPHIRLIKFVAAVPHRRDDKVGGVKSQSGPKEEFYSYLNKLL